MSTAGKSNISRCSDINLIFKMDENVIFTKTIDNNKYNLKNIGEIEEFLEKDDDIQKRSLYIEKLELDKNYLIMIISKYSQLYNNGTIDWNFNYNDIPFSRLKKLSYMPITINISVKGCIGAAGGSGIIPTIKSTIIIEFFSAIIQFIIGKIILFAYNKIIENIKREREYDFFKENYNIDKEYLHKIIKTKNKWKKGFIDANIYDDRDEFEKKDNEGLWI